MDETTRRDRILEIDWLKGFAILSVICIHAKVMEGTWVYQHVIDRAVPIFLVLFGVSSELWWQQAAGDGARGIVGRWYRARFVRLLVPVWTAFTLWWILVATLRPPETAALDLRHVAATYLGFAPWIGVSWFVTIILQLVLLFPLIRWLVDRLGASLSLIVTATVTALCALALWRILDAGRFLFGNAVAEPGWWYEWVFSPRALWHVTAGILIARAGARPGWRAALAALALWLVALALDRLVHDPSDKLVAPLRQHALARLADVPVTVLLLYACRALRPEWRTARFLAFCGVGSWGIYLGHMLVHELTHALGRWPEQGSAPERVGYAVVLLVGGTALAWIGAAVRDRLPLPAARAAPRPDVPPGRRAPPAADQP